jgi:hypothetical protein
LELKREAARQGRTMSELAETALRLLLRSRFPMLRRVRHRAARFARPRRTRPFIPANYPFRDSHLLRTPIIPPTRELSLARLVASASSAPDEP